MSGRVTLRTLGTGTVAPHPARVCAGHLVETPSQAILFDCGSGIVHRLAQFAPSRWATLSHVVLTHFHLDHVGDLPILLFASKYGTLPARTAPLQVVGPVGTTALLGRMAAAYGDWVRDPGFPVQVLELAPDASVALGDEVRLTTRKVPHTAESMAYSIDVDGHRLVYTGDTGWDETLGRWAAGCDLLLAECSLPASMAIPEHLSPEQCGALAALARPRRLALTHFYPPVEAVDVAAIVRAAWTGAVTLAEDGMLFSLEDD